MEFCCIFDNCNLYAVSLGEEGDAFSVAMRNWKDVEYLRKFLNANKKDLEDEYHEGRTINSIITSILTEQKELRNKILIIAKLKGIDQTKAIKALFKPLDNFNHNDLRKKAKAKVRKPFLRLYAVGIDEKIIVTGGAIKLTATMRNRSHLLQELTKLDAVKDFLKTNGIVDGEGFTDLMSEL